MNMAAVATGALPESEAGHTILIALLLLVMLCPLAYGSFVRARHMNMGKIGHQVRACLYLTLGVGVFVASLVWAQERISIPLAIVLAGYFLALSVVHIRQIKHVTESG